MKGGRARHALATACAAAGLFLADENVEAQSADDKRAAVRATSTVEVIDVGRGVDDIISRVRAQQRAQGLPPAAPESKGPAGARLPKQPNVQDKADKADKGQPADERVRAEDLRGERPERPRARLEHERRDGHHLDRDAGRRGQAERARENRK